MNRLLNTFRAWQERRQAIKQLATMPDHLLADIGIERCDIPTVVGELQQRAVAPGTQTRPAVKPVLSHS
ncbi:MAG: DUF1127 domain-containing protein [Candidatus Competibacterales bacterium]|nr:DUF1127 domain-containing protein [Candidatus Competibacterales bacterium]